MHTLKSLPEYLNSIPKKLEITKDQLLITEKLTSTDIFITNKANLTFVALLSQGWAEEQFINFHLQHPETEVNFICLIIGEKNENFTFQTDSIHEAAGTKAYYHIRGAQFDKSTVKYRGCLTIKPQAQQTDAYLSHNTLIFSKNAKVETIPCLEIEADDVKAGHAATIGKADEETIHYMQTRGLDRKTAQDMLIKGFMEADLHKIPNEAARLQLIHEIENALNEVQGLAV